MNCSEWEERLALYAGGDLPPGEAAQVERHLGECAGCQVFLSGVTAALSVLQEAHAEQPAEAHLAAVRARVLGELEHRQRRRWLVWGLAAGMAALFMIAAVALRPVRREVPAPPLPRVAVTQPPAVHLLPNESVVPVRPARLAHRKHSRQRPAVEAPELAPQQEPITVKLMTDDPDVVIYWITDNRGD
jgi:anti-sigma factor RsiW